MSDLVAGRRRPLSDSREEIGTRDSSVLVTQLSPAQTRRYFSILRYTLFYCPSLGRRQRNIEHVYTRKKR